MCSVKAPKGPDPALMLPIPPQAAPAPLGAAYADGGKRAGGLDSLRIRRTDPAASLGTGSPQ